VSQPVLMGFGFEQKPIKMQENVQQIVTGLPLDSTWWTAWYSTRRTVNYIKNTRRRSVCKLQLLVNTNCT